MADNAASDFIGGARRIADAFYNTMDKIPTPHRKVDTSWHDEMVEKANESFRKAAEKDKTKRKAQGKLPGAGTRGLKKAAKKKIGGRKRATGKR
jgi:hypothetical protein